MSFQITTAFVNGFKNNILMLAQQKEARVFGKSRNEVQHSEMEFHERIGSVDVQDIVGRHGDTPIMNTPHSRRAVTLADSEWGDMIDKLDKVRLLIEPENAYVQSAVMAMNRKKDDVFIASALGNAYSGKDGKTTVALPDSQKVAATTGSALSNLNVHTLRLTAAKFDAKDVDEAEKKYFALTQSQKYALLAQTEITNADYNTVKALVNGQINSFLGFEFIRTERLPVTAANLTVNKATGAVGSGSDTLTAGARRCFSWCESGMLSAIGSDIMAQVAPRADKRFGTQVYVQMSVGATRLEEEKVVEVLCTEA